MVCVVAITGMETSGFKGELSLTRGVTDAAGVVAVGVSLWTVMVVFGKGLAEAGVFGSDVLECVSYVAVCCPVVI